MVSALTVCLLLSPVAFYSPLSMAILSSNPCATGVPDRVPCSPKTDGRAAAQRPEGVVFSPTPPPSLNPGAPRRPLLAVAGASAPVPMPIPQPPSAGRLPHIRKGRPSLRHQPSPLEVSIGSGSLAMRDDGRPSFFSLCSEHSPDSPVLHPSANPIASKYASPLPPLRPPAGPDALVRHRRLRPAHFRAAFLLDAEQSRIRSLGL
eukprot:GGOE01022765.1.p2 GENE.GGOE01022765.1~~GGOE01022765.1.p2  ORF type:complete len:205 (-),score=15.31 GGOE01022765.1:369-983(-)